MNRFLFFVLLSTQTAAGIRAEPVRISAWYWLNSAPRDEWERDFRNMAGLGFTHVDLCWGLDLAAWRLRLDDTKYALAACRRAGLGAYLVVWQPTHNTLPRRPEFQQVDVLGRLRFSFDTFNSQWRETEWKDYLQTVAKLYAKDPAFAGYMFDDSFSIGPVKTIDGIGGKPGEDIVSYSQDDIRRFGRTPPHKPSDPGWSDWMAARAKWWGEWAQDTNRFIRAVDPNMQHEVYLEDSEWVRSQRAKEMTGLDFATVAKPFDAVGIYTVAHWDGKPDQDKRAAQQTQTVLRETRDAVGPNKKIIYTFWVSNIDELNNPGPAKYPNTDQIRQICEAALKMGIRHLDMYGYRIGDFVVTNETWAKKRPPATGPYPITGQYPHKHLYDRPELHDSLRTYLHSLNRH
ncbi:MAG: hypothetical protein U0Q18_23350 [Bryobacteraceae bacterium]